MKGIVLSGEFDKIVVRQKAGAPIEIGELLIAETMSGKIMLECYDLVYGSQISQQNLELISGMRLEENHEVQFMDPETRSYTLALLKPVLFIQKEAKLCKKLPEFFSSVRELAQDDLSFLTKPQNALELGKLRSGSNSLPVTIELDGHKLLSHHILITGTTGRGKSVLQANVLWNTIDKQYCGMLVLDPHDEYYGRNSVGLKDHSTKPVYYTTNPFPGAITLQIHFRTIRPSHFNGVIRLTDPQQQAMSAYYRRYAKDWIEAIVLEKPLDVSFHEGTIAVIRRILLGTLGVERTGDAVHAGGAFSYKSGESTVGDICKHLENGRTVIIDTSNFPSRVELLIGSLIATEVFRRYKQYKVDGLLANKPVISIVLEEAPRVLGKEVLEQGSNIFSTIAREGRKFQVGLIAITQLPSLIPRQVLANINTKIILGIEMGLERQAVIDSASQDLSKSARAIASLDRGEAIITSSFTKFAIPLTIPFTQRKIKETQQISQQVSKQQISFGGMI